MEHNKIKIIIMFRTLHNATDQHTRE